MVIKQPINQVRLTNVAVVRLRKKGKRFEVACYKNKLLNWKAGIEGDIDEVLHTEAIFQNVSKGQLAKVSELQDCFGTKDHKTIALMIIEEGQSQVTQEERDVTLNAIFKNICALVSKKVFNLHTYLPMTIPTIESLLNSIGFSASMELPVKRQALKATKALSEAFPEEIGRCVIRLNLSFLKSQESQVMEFLENNCTFLAHEALEISECSSMLSCSIDPLTYKILENYLTNLLKPPASHQIINPNECLLLNESTASRPDDSKAEEHTSPPKLRQEAVIFQPDSFEFKCHRCQIEFSNQIKFKEHFASEWHTCNVKRQVLRLPPVSLDEFTEGQLRNDKNFVSLDL